MFSLNAIDKFLYESIADSFNQQEIPFNDDIILVDIYPRDTKTDRNRLEFRKNVDFFLQKLLKVEPKPKVVGLDIYFGKFKEDFFSDMKDKKEFPGLIKNVVEKLREEKVPIVTGYNPNITHQDHDENLISCFTFDYIGHNVYYPPEVKTNEMFYFKPIEKFRREFKKDGSDSKSSIIEEPLESFAVLIERNIGHSSDKGYKDYDVLPVRYYHNFDVCRYKYPDDAEECLKYYGADCEETDFSNKIVIVGNCHDFKGVFAMASAVWHLTYKKDTLRILPEWLGFIFAIIFPIVGIWPCRSVYSAIISIILFLLFVGLPLMWNHVFTNFTLALAGILSSNVLFYAYEGKTRIKKAAVMKNVEKEKEEIRRKGETEKHDNYSDCFENINKVKNGIKDLLLKMHNNNDESLSKSFEQPFLLEALKDIDKENFLSPASFCQLNRIIRYQANWKYCSKMLREKKKDFKEKLDDVCNMENALYSQQNHIDEEYQRKLIYNCTHLLEKIKSLKNLH